MQDGQCQIYMIPEAVVNPAEYTKAALSGAVQGGITSGAILESLGLDNHKRIQERRSKD